MACARIIKLVPVLLLVVGGMVPFGSSQSAGGGGIMTYCDEGTYGGAAWITVQAEGYTVRAEAMVNVTWLTGGTDRDSDADEGPDEATASADVVNHSRWAEEVEVYFYAAAAGYHEEPTPCGYNLVPDVLPSLPAWVEAQLLQLGCAWQTGDTAYTYSGELTYDNDTQTIALVQVGAPNLNITATPLLTADAQQTTLSPARSTGLTVSAVGDDGCELVIDEV